MPSAPNELELGTLLIGLVGGLAFFLFGMRLMTEALKLVAGDSAKRLLSKLTTNRFTALLAGTLVTAVVQSSSVTSVLVVGFVTAGVMNLTQSIGVIIGVNIGTTITSQIIAFNIAQYGLLLVAVGFFVQMLSRRERVQHFGSLVLGLGIIFFGLELMTGAMAPLRTWQPLLQFLGKWESPLFGVVVGVLFTAIIQSSSAMAGMVIVAATQDVVTPEMAIAIILGANVGTCVTVVISAMGQPREAMQVAVVHVLYNTIGLALWFYFIPVLVEWVQRITPNDVARQIANAHSLFNISTALFCIWLTSPLAAIARWVVPLSPKQKTPSEVHFLDDFYLENPPSALDRVNLELVHQAEIVDQMLTDLLDTITQSNPKKWQRLQRENAELDELHGAIIIWLGKLSMKELLDPHAQLVHSAIGIANYLENMGDVMEANLVTAAKKAQKLQVVVSQETRQMLKPLHAKVVESFQDMLTSLKNGDAVKARNVVDSKTSVNRLANRATTHLISRLIADQPNRLATFRFETDIIEGFKRLHTLIRRIARIILATHGHPDVKVLQADVSDTVKGKMANVPPNT